MITDRTIDARVSPLRFTLHAPEITDLYETIGLRRALSKGDFTALAGRTGTVVVHPLQTAEFVVESTISFQLDVPDTTEAVDLLDRHGVPGHWWDESWGRLGEISSPLGRFSLGTQDDTYGYEEHPSGPSPVDVVQVVRTADPEAARRLFELFGFAADDTGRRMRSATSGGAILLEDGDPIGADAWVSARIDFATSEPLGDLAGRLEERGYAVDAADGSVVVRDAEGAAVRVSAVRPS